MSRHSSAGSYGHVIIAVYRLEEFELRFTVDYYYEQRGRFPRTFHRFTDRAGAERFAKRWGVAMPEGR